MKGPSRDNIEIGTDRGRYLTEQRQSFKDRDLNAAKCEIDIAAKSKQDHFQIGGQGNDAKLTVYQDEFRPDLEHKSRLFHK